MLPPQNLQQGLLTGSLALIGVVLVGAALFLVLGLYQARSLFRRELGAYFLSPIAYVVMAVFLLVTGYRFYLTLDLLTASGPRGTEFPMQYMLSDERFWLVFLFLPPLLTMRLFAEERGSGTLEVLLTSPLREWQIVLTKYLACYTFYLLLWLPTLAYLPVLLDMHQAAFHPVWTVWSITLLAGLGGIVAALLLFWLHLSPGPRLFSVLLLVAGVAATGVGGWMHSHHDALKIFTVEMGIDPGPVLTTYLGLALAGAMFLAIGLLISSLVKSQLVAALVSLVVGLIFVVAGFWRPVMEPGSTLYQVLFAVSVPLHFARDFTRGVIDSRHLALYVSLAGLALFLTVRSLESRRWR